MIKSDENKKRKIIQIFTCKHELSQGRGIGGVSAGVPVSTTPTVSRDLAPLVAQGSLGSAGPVSRATSSRTKYLSAV